MWVGCYILAVVGTILSYHEVDVVWAVEVGGGGDYWGWGA